MREGRESNREKRDPALLLHLASRKIACLLLLAIIRPFSGSLTMQLNKTTLKSDVDIGPQ